MATRIFMKPSPRVTAKYTLASNDIVVLRFDMAAVQVGKKADDLVFTHANGARTVLQNFLAESEAPKASFIIGENAIAGQDLLNALGQELMPAAGPATTDSHGHYEMSLSSLLEGINALGGLDLQVGLNSALTEQALPSLGDIAPQSLQSAPSPVPLGTPAPPAFTVQPPTPPVQPPVPPVQPPVPPDIRVDHQPSVRSFAASLTEDAPAHIVQGNVLLGAVQGDGQTVLRWENSDIVGRFGSITRNADGTFVYTLDDSRPAVQGLSLGQTVQESFAYSYTDADGSKATGSLTITIVGTNDSPAVQAGFAQTAADGPILHSTLPAPVDVDVQDTVSFVPQADSHGQYGSLSVQADGSYTYVLNNSLGAVQALGAGASLTETFTYTVVDSHGATASNTLTITINGTNDSPTIAASAGAVVEDGPILHSTLPAPVDVDAQDTISFVPQADSHGQYGSLSVQADGSYAYVLNNSLGAVQGLGAGASLTETFTYTVVDSHGATASNVLTITINGTNDSPTIAASAGAVAEDGPILHSTLPAPVDVDAQDTISFVLQADSHGQYGSLSVQADGSYTYILNNSLGAVQALGAGASLTETFSYTVVDSHGATASNVLTITINGTNDSPTIAASAGAVAEDGPILHSTLPAPVDVDAQDTVSFVPQADSHGQYGSLSVQADGSYTYIVNNSLVAVQSLGVGANLTDTFTYTVVDSHGATASNVLTIIINGTNDSPTIAASAGAVVEDGPILHSTLPAPADVDAQDTVSFVPQADSHGQYGSLSVQADGSYAYSLNNSLVAVQSLGAGASLTETFTYTVVDSHGATASNVLTITINGTNDSPTIAASADTVREDSVLTASGLLPSIIDVDQHDTVAFMPQDGVVGTYGTLSVDSRGAYTYTLHNDLGAVQSLGQGAILTDTFSYTVMDNHGATASNVLTITINGTNDSPTIAASAGAVVEDGPILHSTLPAPADVDAQDTVSFVPQADSHGQYGSLSVQADGSYAYSLNNSLVAVQSLGVGANLTDTFTYTVVDSHGATASNTLTITINGTNDKPIAIAAVGTVYEDGPSLSSTLPAPTDIDAHDGYDFVPLLGSAGQYGKLDLQTDGSYTYTLNNDLLAVQRLGVGASLTDVFTCIVVDSHGADATTTLTITINGTNDSPTLAASAGSVDEDGPSLYSFLTPPVDVDVLDTHSFIPQLDSPGRYGNLSVRADGSYTYGLHTTLTAVQALGVGETLTDTFTYTVVDAHGAEVASILTVTINGTNDSPTLVASMQAVTEDGPSLHSVLSAPVDVDIHDTHSFVPQTGSRGEYGSLTVQADGSYTYALNNTLAAVQRLGVGESLRESFTYTVTDNHGATASNILTIVINGSNDKPTVAASVTAVTEDVLLSASGQLPSPVDADQHDTTSFVPLVNVAGSYGSLSVNSSGVYVYTLNNSLAAVQSLGVGEQITDIFHYTVVDSAGGTGTNVLTISVNGTNDAPRAFAATASVTEDSNVSVTSVLPVPVDVDNHDVLTFVPQPATAGSYGSFQLQSNGSYTYTLNNNAAAVQALGAGEKLTDVFVYSVQDTHGASSTNSLTVTINGTNDAPTVGGTCAVAVEDSATVISGSLTTPHDVDAHDVLTFVPQSSLAGNYGTLHVAADGSYTYTLHNNLGLVQGLGKGESLFDSFSYKVVDGKGGSANTTLVVQVQGTNDAPSVSAAANSVREDTMLVASGVLPVIVDADNTSDGIVSNSLSFVPQPYTAGLYGSLSLDSAGHYTYTLNNSSGAVQGLSTGEQLSENFIYTAVDSSGATGSNILTITIKGTNDNPVAVASVNTAIEDRTTVVEGTITPPQDVDNSADNVVSDVLHCIPKNNERGLYGTLNLDAEGHYTYVLNNSLASVQGLGAGDTLTEVFFYTVLDSHGGISTNTLSLSIQGTNDAPITSASSAVVYEDYQSIVNGILHASDPDNTLDGAGTEVLSFSTKLNERGTYGSLTLAKDGSYVYSLDNTLGAVQGLTQGEKLYDQFQYTVTDTHGAVSTNTLTISVNGTNDAPVAFSASASVQEDVQLVATGTVPAPQDPDNTKDGIVSDTVRCIPMNNVQGSYGTLSLDSVGHYVYTLDNSSKFVQGLSKGQVVEDLFPYLVADEHGAVVGSTIRISVVGTAEASSGAGGGGTSSPLVSLQVTEDSSLLGIDHIDLKVGGVSLHLMSVGVLTGQYGKLSLQADGTCVYTLNNALAAVQGLGEGESLRENFMVTLGGLLGGSLLPSLISVQINGTNDAPLAAVQTQNLVEDTSAYVSNCVRPVYDVDNNADGIISDLVTVIPQTILGQYGLFTITGNGNYTYVLNNSTPTVQMLGAGESVTEQFAYTVQDGHGGTSRSVLNFVVQGSNDLPTVAESYANLTEGARVSLAGHLPAPVDVDSHDAVIFVPQVVQGLYGQWVLNSSGDYAYTLNSGLAEQLGAGESVVESFSYTVRDSQGGMGTNSLHINIFGRNDAPTVASATASVSEDTNLTVTGLLPSPVDVDAHDTPFFVAQNATEGQYGTFYLSPGGGYTYILHNDMPVVQALGQGEVLTESLSYMVSDGKGGTGTALLHININGTNDLPTVESSVAAVMEDSPSFMSFLSTPTAPDAHDSLSFVPLHNVMGMYGSLNVAVDGSFSYTPNSESALVQGLGQDEKATDVFSYTVIDGHGGTATNTLMVHLTGQNDVPIAGTLALGTGPVEDGQMLATGTLPMPLDPDTHDTVTFVARETVQGEYGMLSVQADGHYVYTLQNNLAAVQALGEGQVAVDEFSIMATDGQGASTAATLQMQIVGSNDTPIITGSTAVNMTEDSTSLTGLLSAPMDVDAEDTVLFAAQHTTVGQFGTLSVQSDGQYVYTLNTTLRVVQQLGEGENLTESFDYSVNDGHGGKAFSTLHININGTNDAPIVVGNVSAATAEDLTLTGNLPTPHDVDQHDIVGYAPQTDQHGQYGSWSVQADGNYSYTVDPSKAAVQSLHEGESITEHITYTVYDSHGATTAGSLSITIDGSGMQELLHPLAASGYSLLNGDGVDSLDLSAFVGTHDSTAAALSTSVSVAELGGILTADSGTSLETVLASSTLNASVTAAPTGTAPSTSGASQQANTTTDVQHGTTESTPATAHTALDNAVGSIHVESTESMQDSIQQELVKQSGG